MNNQNQIQLVQSEVQTTYEIHWATIGLLAVGLFVVLAFAVFVARWMRKED
jgi:hypothetical protein